MRAVPAEQPVARRAARPRSRPRRPPGRCPGGAARATWPCAYSSDARSSKARMSHIRSSMPRRRARSAVSYLPARQGFRQPRPDPPSASRGSSPRPRTPPRGLSDGVISSMTSSQHRRGVALERSPTPPPPPETLPRTSPVLICTMPVRLPRGILSRQRRMYIRRQRRRPRRRRRRAAGSGRRPTSRSPRPRRRRGSRPPRACRSPPRQRPAPDRSGTKCHLQRPPREADLHLLDRAAVDGAKAGHAQGALVAVEAPDRARAAVGVGGRLDVALPVRGSTPAM